MKERKSGLHLTKSAVFWGLILILAAAALILDGAGISFGMGFTALHVVGGILLLAWLGTELFRGKIWNIFFPLAFLFMLFEGFLAGLLGREDPNLISNWIVLLAALLLTIGSRLLFRREKKGIAMGDRALYLDGGELEDVRISENLGKVNVYIVNPERYEGEGRITVQENLGQVVIHLPEDWFVKSEVRETIGAVNVPTQTWNGGKVIVLSVRENIGEIRVIFEKSADDRIEF